MPNLAIPNSYFRNGIPGLRGLFEWFAIVFRGQLIVPEGGAYDFQLSADDAANLYIDGAKIVDDDGRHPVRSASGSINLAAGPHAIRVDYYQGPADYVALQLWWRARGSHSWAIVPASALDRP